MSWWQVSRSASWWRVSLPRIAGHARAEILVAVLAVIGLASAAYLCSARHLQHHLIVAGLARQKNLKVVVVRGRVCVCVCVRVCGSGACGW
jgi:hypothetical protein